MKHVGIGTLTTSTVFTLFVLRPVQAMTATASQDTLFSAAAKGDNIQVRRLLHAGVPVDGQGEHGPALVYAAEQGHLSTIKLLMGAGAHLYACDKESAWDGGKYNRALLEAASEGYTEVVRYLLHKGVNKDGQDQNGYNPLLAAATRQHWEVVRLLLASGARPNYQTRNYQNSALILAAEFGRGDLVQALLRHRADVKAVDKYGHSALWYAHDYHFHAIARMLRRAGTSRLP